jgi:leukotriene-A4 hydrolase
MRLRSSSIVALVLPLALAGALLVTACRTPPASAPVGALVDGPVAVEPSSYAEPQHVVIKHLSLQLRADFTARTLSGSATLELTWRDAEARDLVLDTRDLTIVKVEAQDGGVWKDAPFELAKNDPIFGAKLTIHLQALAAQATRVRLTYATSPQASGLQWMPPGLTLGKKLPLMFSQSQAIHARSWVPLQDTPGVRFTYDAQITTPPEVMALMSATNDPNAQRTGSYRFDMPQPIPSYLLAIAVGDLVFRPVSERAGVWSEPGMVERAAREFEDTEKMIVTAEKLYGPYRWGRYDVLVLPPSFPFGGMENPRLTFATPTIVVGDKSLVSLIAHELAHSWSGNLVTNATWSDIWLNEGFTTYVESRIVEELYGRDFADMEKVIGQVALRASIQEEIAPADQLLALPALTGRDPGEASSDIAYVKGQWFLFFLEERFGRPTFDAFLRRWFDAHAFATATSAQFEHFLTMELLAKVPGKVTEQDVHQWMHEPGIPTSATEAKSSRFDAVDAAAAEWLAGKRKAVELPVTGWGWQQWVRFLLQLPRALPAARVAELDAAHHLTGVANPEISERWYPLTVRSGYTAPRTAIRPYLISIGRRKLITPTYTALGETADGLAFAQAVFAEARAGYHPITVASIEELLAAAQKKLAPRAP